MADYFVSLKRIFPQGDPMFFGPYDKKEDAIREIDNALKEAEFEIITSEKETPNDIASAILAEIYTKTAARRTGMKSIELFGDKKDTLIISATLPRTFKEIGIEKINGNGRKNKSIETITEIIKEDKNKVIEDISITKSAEVLSDYERSEAIVITKFPQNIEWLRQHGVHGEVLVRARPDQIENRSVVGTLPYRLGVLAKRVGVIDIPGIRADQIGTSLSTNDLYNAEAILRWFRVIEEKDEWQVLFNFLDKPGNWKKVLQLIQQQ